MNQQKTNIVVCIDGDGHFHITPLHQRDKVIETIKSIHYGDYLENMICELPEDFLTEYINYSAEQWSETIQKFKQRGTLEIIELEVEFTQ